MKNVNLFIISLLTIFSAYGQVGINTENPLASLHIVGNEYIDGTGKMGGDPTFNASAQLELGDNDKALLLNRVALIKSDLKNPVADVVDGMLVYNTATVVSEGISPGLYFWRTGAWHKTIDQLPVTGIRMYYQTVDIVAGIASGSDQSRMRKLIFSPTGAVHAPVDLLLPESGSYAFNVKLYTQVCNASTGAAIQNPNFTGKVIAYLGIWVNNVLQDVSEVFYQISTTPGSLGITGANMSSVVLGCSGKAGDKIEIRVGYLQISLPLANGILSQGAVSSRPLSNRTSMLYWKL